MPTMNEALESVATAFDIDKAEILSKTRIAPVFTARVAFVLIARETCNRSHSEIGAFINRDHTTIINAVNKARQRMYDAEFREKFEKALGGCKSQVVFRSVQPNQRANKALRAAGYEILPRAWIRKDIAKAVAANAEKCRPDVERIQKEVSARQCVNGAKS